MYRSWEAVLFITASVLRLSVLGESSMLKNAERTRRLAAKAQAELDKRRQHSP